MGEFVVHVLVRVNLEHRTLVGLFSTDALKKNKSKHIDKQSQTLLTGVKETNVEVT